jgi:hypothetical protein
LLNQNNQSNLIRDRFPFMEGPDLAELSFSLIDRECEAMKYERLIIEDGTMDMERLPWEGDGYRCGHCEPHSGQDE